MANGAIVKLRSRIRRRSRGGGCREACKNEMPGSNAETSIFRDEILMDVMRKDRLKLHRVRFRRERQNARTAASPHRRLGVAGAAECAAIAINVFCMTAKTGRVIRIILDVRVRVLTCGGPILRRHGVARLAAGVFSFPVFFRIV